MYSYQKGERMKPVIVFLLAMTFAFVANGQEADDLLTVGRIKQAWLEGSPESKEPFQRSFYPMFTGHFFGFAQGVSVAAMSSGAADKDMTAEFVSCIPATDRLFYMLLAAPETDDDLNVMFFATKVVLDLCGETIDRVL